MNTKILKVENNNTYYSVLVSDGNMELWVDLDLNLESADWNKYIFYLNNEKDMQIKKFQENPENFELFTSTAIEFLDNYHKLKF